MNLLGRRGVRAVAFSGLLAISGAALAQDDPWQGGEEMLQTARAEADLAEAREHRAAGRYRDAEEAYLRVLAAAPDNQEALDGVEAMRRQLDRGSTLVDTDLEIERLRDQTSVEFNEAMRLAEQALSIGSYDEAEHQIVTIRVKLNQRRTVLRPADLARMETEANRLLDEIDRAREEAALLAEKERQDEAAAAKSRREAEEAATRQRIVNENLRRVRQLQSEMKYDEAIQLLDETLFVDELNPAALALRDAFRSTMDYLRYADIQRQKEQSYTDLLLGGQAGAIAPYRNIAGPGMRSVSGVMQYPEDWPQVSRRRSGGGGMFMSDADRQVRNEMMSISVPVDFDGNTLDQVISFMQNVSGVRIYVDWKALEFAGIDPDDEITLQLAEVPMSTALDRVLDSLGADADRPQWDIQDGMLVVSSDEAMRKRTVTLVYDIRDLLFEVPYFDNAPSLNLDAALNQGGNVGGGGGGGGGGFGGGGGGGGGFGGGGGGGGGGFGGGGGGSLFDDPDEADRTDRQELIDQIVTIVQDSIDPEGWRDLGGDTGTLQELNGNLIISNTPRNHQAIDGLLSQLREIRALQINVEGRFLEVNTDWFEQIGVDLDLYFNTNSSLFKQLRTVDPTAQLADFFTSDGRLRDPLIFGSTTIGFDENGDPITEDVIPWGNLIGVPDAPDTFDGQAEIEGITYQQIAPVAPVRHTEGFSPVPFIQNSFGLVEELANLTPFGAIAAANPALVTGISYLDDIQVDLLIEATQADNRSVILTAPRLTLFNGQRAWVAVTTSTAFVSGLQAVTGDAAGAFVPQIGQLREGFVLDVEAVADASRRYVTMTVIASLAQNAGFRETDASEFGGATGSAGIIGAGAGAGFSGRIELPQISLALVQTTVSVPDKGTILLGGQRFVNEIEVESGVPVLSKIPFINRFFTNRLTNKEESTLLILIRPEVIITQENEDTLFPGLSDSIGSSSYGVN